MPLALEGGVLTTGPQCCISFRCYIKVIQLHIYTYIDSFSYFFPFKLKRDIEFSFLCYTVGPCCLSILYIVVNTFIFICGTGDSEVT